jgi:hypothetical protein
MEKSTLISWRLFAGGSFLLAVIICAAGLGSSSAHASCGDWLAHSGNSMFAAEDGAKSPGQTTAASGTKRNGPLERPLSAPCRGLRCSKAPVDSSPPSSPSIEVRIDRIALVTHVSSYGLPEQHFFRRYEVSAHSSKGFLPRIEHPPRV